MIAIINLCLRKFTGRNLLINNSAIGMFDRSNFGYTERQYMYDFCCTNPDAGFQQQISSMLLHELITYMNNITYKHHVKYV